MPRPYLIEGYAIVSADCIGPVSSRALWSGVEPFRAAWVSRAGGSGRFPMSGATEEAGDAERALLARGEPGGGGWPRISASMANNRAMRSNAACAIGDLVAACTS